MSTSREGIGIERTLLASGVSRLDGASLVQVSLLLVGAVRAISIVGPDCKRDTPWLYASLGACREGAGLIRFHAPDVICTYTCVPRFNGRSSFCPCGAIIRSRSVAMQARRGGRGVRGRSPLERTLRARVIVD